MKSLFSPANTAETSENAPSFRWTGWNLEPPPPSPWRGPGPVLVLAIPLASMDARRHRMTLIRPHRRRATAKRGQDKNCTEHGKKNGSHKVCFAFSLYSGAEDEATVFFGNRLRP